MNDNNNQRIQQIKDKIERLQVELEYLEKIQSLKQKQASNKETYQNSNEPSNDTK